METWFVAWEIPKTTPTLNAVRWRRASLTLACITGHKHRPFLFQRISSNPIHQQSQKETMQHHKNRISLLSSGWGETKGGSLLSPALCYSLCPHEETGKPWSCCPCESCGKSRQTTYLGRPPLNFSIEGAVQGEWSADYWIQVTRGLSPNALRHPNQPRPCASQWDVSWCTLMHLKHREGNETQTRRQFILNIQSR